MENVSFGKRTTVKGNFHGSVDTVICYIVLTLRKIFYFIHAVYILVIKRYRANLENMVSSYNARKWQMGYNSVLKGLLCQSTHEHDKIILMRINQNLNVSSAGGVLSY